MPDWDALFAAAVAAPPPVVTAQTFVKKWATASQPAALECDDGVTYVVKGRQAGRMVANDQIVARLGSIANAPTGVPTLVDVPADLIAREPELQHFQPGIAHGTVWLSGCGERAGIDHMAAAENRGRFAGLAWLFGWLAAGDHQFIYENAAPHRVYSVDHGHFFPGGPDWTTASLAGAPAPAPFSEIITSCGLTTAELEAAKPAYRAVTDEAVGAAVAAPPDDWGLNQSERVALAGFVASRRDVLFA